MLATSIALRYTLGHRRGRLASFISWMAIAGLILGVALLVVVSSVMNGFDRELRERILALVPHVHVYANNPSADFHDWNLIRQTIAQNPDVEAVTPMRQLYALLRFRGESRPVSLNGIDPLLELEAGGLGDILPRAQLQSLLGDSNSLILGSGVAVQLGVSEGDRLTFVMPRSEANSLISGTATVSAIFSTGTELDNQLAFYSFQNSGFPVAMQGADGLRIYLTDLFEAFPVARGIMAQLPPTLTALTWESSHGNLYQAIQLSRQMVGMIVFLVLAIAAFNVIASLLIVSADKQGEMAILKTMGASGMLLGRVFAIQGLFIGLVGTALGVAIGLLLAVNITAIARGIETLLNIQLLDLSIYPIDYIPADIQSGQVMMIALLSVVLCVVASIYPAVRGARSRPAAILRHE